MNPASGGDGKGHDPGLGKRLRRVRTERGLSLREAARRADVTASFLSQVEKGQVAPSLSSLRRFCDVLEVSVVEVLEGSRPGGSDAYIIRAGQRPRLRDADTLADVELLVDAAGRPFDVLHVRLTPGSATAEEKAAHDARELLFVISGEATMEIGDVIEHLGAGDSIYFSSQEPHRIVNSGAEDLVFISCIAGRF